MRAIPIRKNLPEWPDPSAKQLARLLLGVSQPVPLPSFSDVFDAVLLLAEGRRCKAILPIVSMPAELVLVRRENTVGVSYVHTDGVVQVPVLDRPLAMMLLLRRLGELAEEIALRSPQPGHRKFLLDLFERSRRTGLPAPMRALRAPIVRRAGVSEPCSTVPLSFGFEAEIEPVTDPPRQNISHSDAHAMLFKGWLWAWVRGRRVPLLQGPIMLALSRMVSAVRALMESQQRGRAVNTRMRAGGFLVGLRNESGSAEALQLTFASEECTRITIPALSVEDAALPILRLGSEMIRALVTVDRAQARNLRVTALRREVRQLRRLVKQRAKAKRGRVVNENAERLRASSPPMTPGAPRDPGPPRALRFQPRWAVEVEHLDAASTFLCGDRIVLASPREVFALARDDGSVLWGQQTSSAVSFMTGRALVRVAGDGEVSLWDVAEGDMFATVQLAPRVGGAPQGLLAGGRDIPPVAILAEGRDRLAAVDLRNGELRWRTRVGAGRLELNKSGRLLFARAEGMVSAFDVASGELVWRFADSHHPVSYRPAIGREVALIASGAQGALGALHGIDLFSGKTLWTHESAGKLAAAPIVAGDRALVVRDTGVQHRLTAIDLATGREYWSRSDPGLASGASGLALDRAFIVNAPNGDVESFSLETGHVQWRRSLAHPMADDVPRRLEPVLRSGALFIPSAQVHLLRPVDGRIIGGGPLNCELIPDWMRVDERGWVYIAEESGHLEALGPRAHLSLVPR